MIRTILANSSRLALGKKQTRAKSDGIVAEHLHSKSQIVKMAWFDLRKSYKGAAFGWFWALIRPLTMLLVYWFVLSEGLNVGSGHKGIGYFSWLAVGMLAWFYMADMLGDGTRSLSSYRYLVTKMKFPVSTIPTFVGLSNLMLHLMLTFVVCVYLVFNGDGISIHWIQLPLYTIFMFMFFVAWSLFAAPLAAISKDFSNLVKSAVRILFWLSGILWSVRLIDNELLKTLMLFNPINFFAEGYRSTLLYNQWFYERPLHLVVFVAMFIVMLALAVFSYRSNRKEISDVL